MSVGLVNITPIGGLLIKHDDEVVVTQPQDRQVLFFDSRGQPLGAFGRQGAAPGEFRSLFAIGLLDEDLWIGDNRLARATIVGPQRQLRRILNLAPVVRNAPTAEIEEGSASRVLLGIGPDWYIGLWFRDGEQLFRATFDGVLLNNLPHVNADEDHWVRLPDGQMVTGNLLGVRPKFDVSVDSRLLVIVRPILTSSIAAASVTLMRAEGDTIFSRVFKFEGDRVARTVVDSIIAQRTASAPQLSLAYRRDAYVPPFYSPIVDVLVGQDSLVWLKLHTDKIRQNYLVLNPDGAERGLIAFPPRTTVGAAHVRTVWAIEMNEFDVPNIIRYELNTVMSQLISTLR